MTNDPHAQAGEGHAEDNEVDGAGEGADFHPSYSEPHYGITHEDGDWEVPAASPPVLDDDTEHASPPDATPLTESQEFSATEHDEAGPSGAEEPPAAPWWDSGRTSSSAATGATSYEHPPYQADPAAPSGGQWQGSAEGQPYQGGAPMGAMPPQPYSGGYGPMSMGPNNPYWLAGPSEQGRNTLQLDYWLSVFFSWIPALIFYLTEKDKNRLIDEHTKELLNFNITRIIVGAVAVIPFVGWILGGIASVVLFVMAILGALKGPDEYANGRTYRFPLTFRFIK